MAAFLLKIPFNCKRTLPANLRIVTIKNSDQGGWRLAAEKEDASSSFQQEGPVPQQPEVRTIRISAHCSDSCSIDALDADGNVLVEYDGYVPAFMPGQHYGDSVDLEIDVATGKINNWTADSAAILKELKERSEENS